MTRNEMTTYGVRYLIAYVLASIAIVLIGLALAALSIDVGSGGGTAIAIAAAVFTLGKFVQDKGRLPTSSEYWTLVLMTTLIAVAVEGVKLLLLLNLTPELYTEQGVWVFALALGAVLIFGTNLIFFSKFFGRSFLGRANARRDRK